MLLETFSRSPLSSIFNAMIPLCEPASAQKTGLVHNVWYLVVQCDIVLEFLCSVFINVVIIWLAIICLVVTKYIHCNFVLDGHSHEIDIFYAGKY